jgi:lysozyme
MDFVNGVDVSDYQGAPSWAAVRASGYSFAIAKATQGTGNTQSTFAGNLAGIRAVGMTAGAYHFLDWNADPVAQANHFLSVYQPRPGDLPPTLDCEACTVDSVAAIAHVSGFISEVEKHLSGRRCLLYMSYSFPGDSLAGGSGFSGHDLWVAAYSNAAEPPVPAAWSKATIWQYSQTGQVGGISGDVDLDRFVGTLDDLKAYVLK